MTSCSQDYIIPRSQSSKPQLPLQAEFMKRIKPFGPGIGHLISSTSFM